MDLVGRYSNFPQHLTQVEQVLELAENPGPTRPLPKVTRIHKVGQRLTPTVLEQIAYDYHAGMTSRELMARYDLGKGTVLRVLRSQGVEIRNQSLTPEQCKQAIALYQDGWSLAKVGRHFDREHTVIRDVLVRACIPRRDCHGRNR